MAVDGIIESVEVANVKNLGDAPAMAMGMLFQGMAADMVRANQNATSNQQAVNVLQQAGIVMGVNKLLNMDPTEAISVLKGMTGNDLSQQLAALMAAISSGEVTSKTGGNTPPVTP